MIKRIIDHPVVHSLVQYRVIVILLTTFVLSASMVPGFLEVRTLAGSLDRVATMGLLAVGLTVVLIAGQLDLSGGAIMALSAITAVGLQAQLGQLPAAGVGVLVGVVAGILNGVLVVVLRVNSLVATLASMLAIRAIAHWVTESRPVSGIDPMFGVGFSRAIYGTVSFRVILFIVAILLLHLWLTRTVSGRNLFAVGSNPTSAMASGIRSNGYLFGTFVFSGLMAGAAGVIQGISVNSGSPVLGESIVLTAIAAVVIGGTRLEGGRGSALGTLGGLLTLGFLITAMEFQSVPAYFQDIVTGLILLLLILLDRVMSSKKGHEVRLSALWQRLRRAEEPTPHTERTHAP